MPVPADYPILANASAARPNGPGLGRSVPAQRITRGHRAFFAGLAPAIGIFFALLLLGVAKPALAHYPWITASKDTEEGTAFRLGSGHVFPDDGPLAVDRLEGIRVVGADGSVTGLLLEDRDFHALPDAADGASLIVAEETPRFWSRTFEGGRPASRMQYPDAFSCTQTVNVMKAVAGHGPGEAWRHRQGHALELMPMNDPAILRAGDPLTIQVLWRGEPWAGQLKATYAGHARDGDASYALALDTDEQGRARFVPAVAADWMVVVHASEEFPDPEVCDRRSHTATLTFRVR